MMRWVSRAQSTRKRRPRMASAVVCLVGLGCGSADSGESLFEEAEPPPAEPVVTPAPANTDDDDPEEMMSGAPDGASTGGEMQLPGGSDPDPDETPSDDGPQRCRPATGVSGAPTNISQAIILLNTLPKPVTLECFLQALDRPLTVYATSSNDSLQPSPGARSPRTFILNGDLEMSIVLEGNASDTLEFGYRPDPSRSIKSEIQFPLTKDLSESNVFDRVRQGASATKCGNCHIGETVEVFPDFPLGAFVSDIIEPFDMDEVTLDQMRAERASCDQDAEAYRCGLLGAIFDHGDVLPGRLRGRE
ncbi:MAG TPA: hypothetical protein VMG12_09240 [Polyangiaceae bacterium]|nr:hypothetical protein [Polyangiaceae bacterium]